MSNNIATVLEELRQDHRNMAMLLNYLEREVEHVKQGGDTDFDLVYDIMDYMTVYPDAVHHPKEDRLYVELVAQRPDLAEGMSKITGEHKTLGEESLALRDDVAQIVAGDFVKRQDVVADAIRYINTLRDHMQWEEAALFRRIDEMVEGGHTVLGATVLPDGEDPLFGGEAEKRFERLLENITPA